MKTLTAALLIATAAPSMAAELIYQPTAPGYTVVQIDSRKLKTTLAQALVAWPGLECTTPADLNGVLNCPGVGLPLTLSYNVNLWGFQAPSVTTVDSKGRVRTDSAKVDGLKQKYWVNARIRQGGVPPSILCPDGLTAITQPDPPAQPIEVNPTVPLTEFGIQFGALEAASLTDIDVEVNGALIGNYVIQPGAIQYVGVSAPEGITSVRFLPHDTLRGQHYGCNDSLTREYGYVFGDRFFYK